MKKAPSGPENYKNTPAFYFSVQKSPQNLFLKFTMSIREIQAEFDNIQKRISQIRGQLLIRNMRNELEILSFLEMIKERPTLAYAYQFLSK